MVSILSYMAGCMDKALTCITMDDISDSVKVLICLFTWHLHYCVDFGMCGLEEESMVLRSPDILNDILCALDLFFVLGKEYLHGIH